MATPGANLSYHNASMLWELFFRRLGFKSSSMNVRKQKTALYNSASDDGTNFPRAVGICAKYSATTAPTTNTAADAPTGKGDICVYVSADNAGGKPIPTTAMDIYRCSAYTNSTTFTWTKLT